MSRPSTGRPSCKSVLAASNCPGLERRACRRKARQMMATHDAPRDPRKSRSLPASARRPCSCLLSNASLPHPTSLPVLTAAIHSSMIQVSWVRQKDLQILASSTFVYTSDPRFRAIHSPATSDWTLEISDPSFNDTGLLPGSLSPVLTELSCYCCCRRLRVPSAGTEGQAGCQHLPASHR